MARGEDLQREPMSGGSPPQTGRAIAHRITRDGEVVIRCRIDELAATLADSRAGPPHARARSARHPRAGFADAAAR
jgi:hypothetical protein